ncbi:MAG: hypothetical protein IJK40_00595, partial [Clostridia bacterium]|nr:hypothetical protein [Clostridia bacterium]
MKKATVLIVLVLYLFSCASCIPRRAPESEPATAVLSDAGDGAAFFRLKELPDVGSYVPPEKPAYFFKDGPRGDFEPRDDYGGILPYCAGITDFYEPVYFYNEETGETDWDNRIGISRSYGVPYPLFGVMTADGRIVTGGAYTVCRRYADGDGSVFWLFEGTKGGASRSCVIAADGKTMVEADSISVEKCGDGYVLACFESYRTHYGYDDVRLHHITSVGGETLLSAAALQAVQEKAEDVWLLYAGGEGFVLRADAARPDQDEEDTDWTDDGISVYYYFDAAGTLRSRVEADESDYMEVLAGKYYASEERGVLDLSGRETGIGGYDRYVSEEADGCFLALRYDDPENEYEDDEPVEVDVYDGSLNKTAHYRTTNGEMEYFHRYSGSCAVGFSEKTGELFSVLTGQTLDPGVGRIVSVYPVTTGDVDFEYVSGPQAVSVVVLNTEDGDWYASRLSDLHTFRISEPAVTDYGYLDAALCQAGTLAFCGGNDIYLYDVETGAGGRLPKLPART